MGHAETWLTLPTMVAICTPGVVRTSETLHDRGVRAAAGNLSLTLVSLYWHWRPLSSGPCECRSSLRADGGGGADAPKVNILRVVGGGNNGRNRFRGRMLRWRQGDYMVVFASRCLCVCVDVCLYACGFVLLM